MNMTAERAKHIHKLVLPINKKVKNINWGGCGIFATAFAGMLTELGFKPTIIGVYKFTQPDMPHKQNIRNIRTNLEKAYSEEVEVYDHYMIKCGKYYFDSESLGTYNLDGTIDGMEDGEEVEYYPIGLMTIRDVDYLNSDSHRWNSIYRRSRNPKLFEYLEKIKPKIINHDIHKRTSYCSYSGKNQRGI